MTDKTTFTNQTEIENEQEQLNEETRMTEEDTGYDNPDIPKDPGLTDEQIHNFRQQNIKSLYAVMYSLGLDGKTDKVREKFDTLSRFFGNIGGVSNISDEELCVIGHMLDELKSRNYKFTF